MEATVKDYLLGTKKTKLIFGLKILFLTGICWLFYSQVSKANINSNAFLPIFYKAISNKLYVICTILLVVPNLLIESYKWQLLTVSIKCRTLRQTFKEVVFGLMLGVVTPFMVGDFVGRSLNFDKSNLRFSALANLFNSICQTYTAIFLGFLSLLFVLKNDFPIPQDSIFVGFYALFFASILGVFFVFDFKILKSVATTNKFFNWFGQNFNQYSNIKNALRAKVLSFTFLRNLVYNLQYILIYKAFGIELPILVILLGINLLLLLKTIGGGLNVLGDLTLRQVFNLYFFGLFAISSETILLATLFIWFINIGLPIIIGIPFLLKFKVTK